MSSSQTSEEDTSSLTRDSIIEYSDIGDSSVLDTSVTVNNEGKLRNAPSSKRDDPVRFYRRKRFWGMCLAVNVVLSAIFIPLLYLVIIPAAARSAINKANLNFKEINITDITNDSFTMNMKGETTGAGPFSAKIEFIGPVSVFFNGNKLGETKLEGFSVSKGKGDLVGTSQKFIIKDKPQFTDFAATTLTAESFKWTIDGNVDVHTFGTKINAKLHKDVIILGSNSFNTSLVDLKINQNPDKSLSLEMSTIIYNPSPIGIELGDMYLQVTYNGTTIANAVAKGVFLNTKENIINMTAVAGLPTTDADRYNYVKVINGYLTNTPVSTVGKVLDIISPNGRIDWLISAAKSLNLTTAVGQAKAPQIISQIDFGVMNMKFTPDAPFSPTFSAKGATAKLTLPFNIDFNVLAVSQNLTLYAQGKPIATVNIPETNVTSTSTELTLDIPETQMNVDKDSEDPFKEFLISLTTTAGTDVSIAGTSDARVTTVIGENIPIQGLPLNISTTLQGLNQFNSGGGPPPVENITILAGNPNELIIGAVVTLTNPSRFSSSTGSVIFNLFFREQQIGTVTIQDLTVVPGPNPLAVVITLNDPENNAGKELITSFLTGQPISLAVRGFDGSTNITSLVPAFKAIDIQTNLPALLPQQLVASSKLTVDNQTASTKGTVEIVNAFVAPISIYTMNSSFSFNGNAIGTYEQDMSNNPIFVPGNTARSLELPVSMNTDPVVSFTMLRTLALQNNLDVSVLDSLIVLSKVNVPGVDPNVQPTPEAIRSFDLSKFITTALAKIPVTIDLDSRIAVGYYFMSITYQQNITVETDSTIVSLISAFSKPMIDQILGQAQMTIDSVFAFDIDVGFFDIYVAGVISNTGPLPAVINFPNGIEISSGDVVLGNVVNIQPIIVDPIDGAKLNGSSRFVIADIPTFTSFSGALLTTDTIAGIGTGDVVVTSFGAQIGPFPIKQSIDMAGLSTLQQKLTGLTLPKVDNPEFSANVALYNPSGFGIELGKVVYDLFIEGEQISTVTGDNVVISPKGVSDLTIHGPIDLKNPKIISSILAKAPLTVQGVSVTPPKATGEVVWLSESFKNMKLTMPTDLSGLGAPAAPGAPPATQQ